MFVPKPKDKIHPYFDRYFVTEFAQVFNRDTYKEVIPKIHINGYVYVTLTDYEGRKHSVRLHRVVAETYLPNPSGLPQVNHIDGVKTNNSISNLEWVSAEENTRHALKEGLRSGYLSNELKELCLSRVARGDTIRSIARELGLNEKSLASILRRHRNKGL